MLLYIDGFDSYGTSADTVAGKWNIGSASPTTGRFGAFATSTGTLGRVLPFISTVCVGAAIKVTSFPAIQLIGFYDTSDQLQVSVNIDDFGRFYVRNGNFSLPLIAYSSHFISLNAWNYFECEMTIGNTTGAFTIRINNQVILTATNVDTQGTSDPLMGGIRFSDVTYDDLYICDTTGAINNGLMGDLRVETLYPDGDVSVQLTSVNKIGHSTQNAGFPSGFSANNLTVERCFCDASGLVNFGYMLWYQNSAVSKSKMVIYSDSSGAVGTLLGSSDEVIGTTNNVLGTYAFVSSPPVTAGNYYWIGVITDTNIDSYNFSVVGSSGISATKAYPYVSGAPASPTGMNYANSAWTWAVTILTGTNFTAVNEPQEDQDFSYVSSNNPGDTDVYSFDNVTADTQLVYGVQISPMARKTGTATRTVTPIVQTPSTAMISATTIYPGINYVYYPTIYNYEPDGSTTWTVVDVNGLTAGIVVG